MLRVFLVTSLLQPERQVRFVFALQKSKQTDGQSHAMAFSPSHTAAKRWGQASNSQRAGLSTCPCFPLRVLDLDRPGLVREVCE